jgi:hypothetical protein
MPACHASDASLPLQNGQDFFIIVALYRCYISKHHKTRPSTVQFFFVFGDFYNPTIPTSFSLFSPWSCRPYYYSYHSSKIIIAGGCFQKFNTAPGFLYARISVRPDFCTPGFLYARISVRNRKFRHFLLPPWLSFSLLPYVPSYMRVLFTCTVLSLLFAQSVSWILVVSSWCALHRLNNTNFN